VRWFVFGLGCVLMLASVLAGMLAFAIGHDFPDDPLVIPMTIGAAVFFAIGLVLLIFNRQIGGFLWATKYRRIGVIITPVILVAVWLLVFGVVIPYQEAYQETLSWSKMNSGTRAWLYGVWGSSASNVFAVGGKGTILHYDGHTWSKMNSGTTAALSDVWGTSASDIFALGDRGTILHYGGSTWSEMRSGTRAWLYGVWGSSASDVFAVGDRGTILHRR